MKKAALTLVTMLVLSIMLLMSTGVALAGWGYDDSVPVAPAPKAIAPVDGSQPIVGFTAPTGKGHR